MLLPIALPSVDRSNFNYHVAYLLPWKNALVPRIEQHGISPVCFQIRHHLDPRAFTRLAHYIRSHDIDLIHAHLPHTGIVARFVAKVTGTKVVYTEHNVWGRLNPLMRLANLTTFGLNNWSIAVSGEVAESMTGVDLSRLSIIDNGIDCAALAAVPDESIVIRSEFGIPSQDIVIGKVANLTKKKNHENLLNAFALLQKEHPSTTLLLVGQPADRETSLRRLAHDLGIATKVVFAGARDDVPRIVRAMDIFVISSDFEGLPVAMLEAMALGKPVVATAVGGIPGIIVNNDVGYLVPPRRPDMLASSLAKLIVDCELRDRMGALAKRKVERGYNISSMIAKVEGIYRQVLFEGSK